MNLCTSCRLKYACLTVQEHQRYGLKDSARMHAQIGQLSQPPVVA